MKSRNFVFTKNNYVDYPEPTQFKYIVWGREIAPTTGTPHLQGFAQLKHPHTIQQACGKLPGCHVEIMRGTCKQARDYAIKGGDFTEHGVFSEGKGARTDLREAVDEVIATGKTDGVDPVTYVRYHSGLEKLAFKHQTKRDWMPEVIVLWGATGTGKSSRAKLMAPTAYWKSPGDYKWWDGYNLDEDIIIDDFQDDQWPRDYILRLCDRYPMAVQIKGGFIQMVARRIIITTNQNPNDRWDPALIRRVAHLHEVR